METDWKQKYEEALNLAKSYYGKGQNEFLDTLFPELAESDDERITDTIFNCLYQCCDTGFISGAQRDDALAWLEKQKEQKPRWEINNPHTDVWTEKMIDDKMEELIEEYHKQKPAEVKDPSMEELEAHNKVLHDFKVFAAKQAKEHHISFVHDFEWNNFCGEILSYFNQPAEWSKEDNSMINNIIDVIETDYQTYNSFGRKPKKKVISWLKSLCPQPKQEWSEEDEKVLDYIIKYFTNYDFNNDEYYKDMSYDAFCKLRVDAINFLKSLRPQPNKEIYQAAKHDLAIRFMNYLDENRPEGKMNLSNGECEDIDKAFKENDWAKIVRYVEKFKPHWKPSEEQMETLEVVVKKFLKGAPFRQKLDSLYNDIKKLKEDM